MMERMWINQPSTLDKLHKLHGMNVLAEPEPNSLKVMRVYFLDGVVTSQQVPRLYLSNGWLPKRDEKFDFLAPVVDEVKPTLETRIQTAAESAILKIIMDGSWIAPDYSNRFKLPAEFIKEVWALVDAESLKRQMASIIERELAEKLIGLMASELSSDIKKVLSDTERREAIRAVVRDNLDKIVQKKG